MSPKIASGTSTPGEGDRQGWLLLVYRVPSEPTRLRAAVWRRLKGLGAVYLQHAVAALPDSPAAERALRKLRHEVVDMGGTAVLSRCEPLVGGADVMEAFLAARDDEYEEIIDRCEDYLTQVAKEHEAAHFTFGELEENEVDLQKLQSWFEKVSERDPFGAPRRGDAETALERCAAALNAYADRVYAEADEAG